MQARLALNPQIRIADFQQFYWHKTELLAFCRELGLSAQGGKIELTQRITTFLTTGKKTVPTMTRVAKGTWDSEQGALSRSTTVVHYKSDPLTRVFFSREIGAHFRFNADVLTWIKATLAHQEKLTYGDIIVEWQRRHQLKQDPCHQRVIPQQFQFNQFMKDWKAAQAGAGAKAAWALMRSLPGEPTYVRYVAVKKGGFAPTLQDRMQNLKKMM